MKQVISTILVCLSVVLYWYFFSADPIVENIKVYVEGEYIPTHCYEDSFDVTSAQYTLQQRDERNFIAFATSIHFGKHKCVIITPTLVYDSPEIVSEGGTVKFVVIDTTLCGRNGKTIRLYKPDNITLSYGDNKFKTFYNEEAFLVGHMIDVLKGTFKC